MATIVVSGSHVLALGSVAGKDGDSVCWWLGPDVRKECWELGNRR